MIPHQLSLPDFQSPRLLRYVSAAVIVLACNWVHSAQFTMNADQDTLLDAVEHQLQQSGWEVVDQAQTDRFAVIYARHAQGSFVTVTLRQLPSDEARVEVSVSTDSPYDSALEQRLLRQFSDG